MVDHFLRFLRDDGGMLGIGVSLTGFAANPSISTSVIRQRDGAVVNDRADANIFLRS